MIKRNLFQELLFFFGCQRSAIPFGKPGFSLSVDEEEALNHFVIFRFFFLN